MNKYIKIFKVTTKPSLKTQTNKKVKALVTQLCPTLWDPIDCSPPGSSVHGILQAKILEWVAIPFPMGSSWPRDRTQGLPHSRQILNRGSVK